MSEPLKPYEKAGRLVRVLAWISLVALLGIGVALLVPMIQGNHNGLVTLMPLVIFLAFLGAMTWFQFFLGTALKEHKDWARIVGIVYGVLNLPAFPIGTIIGGFLLYWLIKGWDDPTRAA